MEKPCKSCGQITPEFEKLSREDEAKVRQEYRDSGPVSSIKKLRETTNSGLKEAEIRVD